MTLNQLLTNCEQFYDEEGAQLPTISTRAFNNIELSAEIALAPDYPINGYAEIIYIRRNLNPQLFIRMDEFMEGMGL